MKWARQAGLACLAQQHLALFIFFSFFILINASFLKNNNNYYI
jgi:hypothetical protein